jgi:hypothetical protein
LYRIPITTNIDTQIATVNNKLCFGTKCIDKSWIDAIQDLYNRTSSTRRHAGVAINGDATTMLLYEGNWNLFDGQRMDAWTNNQWDIVYVNRGWEIILWDKGVNDAEIARLWNKDDDIPQRIVVNNNPSSYTAIWKGF